jgi:RNA polymerase sigma factor (TIGR02999 family)
VNDQGREPLPLERENSGWSRIDDTTYAELKRIAARRMAELQSGNTFQPTMLVHEAWMRLASADHHWNDRKHFLSTAAIAMRHILIDNLRKKSRIRHGNGQFKSPIDQIEPLPVPMPDDEILRLDEGVSELEKTNPLRAQIVVSRFFGGFTNSEIAESLGIGKRSVERHLAAAKLWLFRWMQNSENP